MNSHIRCRVMLSSLALLAMMVTPVKSQTTQIPSVIDVNESRPLWHALDALENVVGHAINYEDPPYQNMADLEDFSTPQQRAAEPGYKLIGPRRARLRAEIEAPSVGGSVDSVILSDVNLLLTGYRQQKLPGDFKIELANDMVYVTPTKVLDVDGTMRDVSSPLMTPITIPSARRNVADTVEAILDAVSKSTKLHIVLGVIRFWPTDMVTFGASGERARDALARLFVQATGGPLSYRLIFDPTSDRMRIFDYTLNIWPPANIAPMATSGPTPAAKSSLPAASASGPFVLR